MKVLGNVTVENRPLKALFGFWKPLFKIGVTLRSLPNNFCKNLILRLTDFSYAALFILRKIFFHNFYPILTKMCQIKKNLSIEIRYRNLHTAVEKLKVHDLSNVFLFKSVKFCFGQYILLTHGLKIL